MSRYDDPLNAPTLHIFYCSNCDKDTEQHRYQAKGWICKGCNN